MKKRKQHISYLLFIGAFLLVTVHATAQNNYPTKAQVDAKNAKLALMQNALLQKGGTAPQLLITGVEQDCSGAIGVCNVSYAEANSYTGFGLTQEVNSTCLLGGETNSVWYTFQATTIGTIGFDIIPNDPNDDYDFAVYNITSGGCGSVPTATPIRCNWSATAGTTGCTPSTTSETPELSEGAMGSNTMTGWQPSSVPQTYVLIIDNWSGSTNGYTLNFTGTATISDPTTPSTASATADCNANTITLVPDEWIDCSTVLLADFILLQYPGPVVVTPALISAGALGCVGNKTKEILLTHNGSLTTGSYALEIESGRILADECGNLINVPGTQNFDLLTAITMSASTNAICVPATAVTLDADGMDGTPAPSTYTLNPGGFTNTTDGIFTVNPIVTTTYTVSVTFGGCTKIAFQTITVEDVVVSITPVDPQVCSFPTTLTASSTLGGAACGTCTYLWGGGETTASISVGSAATYTVQATSVDGCVSNTASSTVTLAATGSTGACMVYYVSSGGGGDGLTKANPTTLSAALTAAECTASILKLQTGTYSFSDFILVKDYVTIEGGYDATYTTKTSDMSGGANSTTLRRDNTADSDDATKCTMFKIQASADDWRLQDLRIELPGSASVTAHANGSDVSNYGVRLDGSGSTGYALVRCHIDAGVGSNQ